MKNLNDMGWEDDFPFAVVAKPDSPQNNSQTTDQKTVGIVEADFDLKAVMPENLRIVQPTSTPAFPSPSLAIPETAAPAAKTQASPVVDLKKPSGENARVKASDKRMINGTTDVNQLVPFKYKWAWEKYLASCANHWMPQEVNMDRDIAQWKNGALSAEQMRLTEMVLGFFSTADSLAANNITLGTYRHITAPEVRQYLLRQAFEEAIHTHTYQYIIESLGMDEAKTFNAYNEVPSIKAKDEFLIPYIECLTDPNFKTGTPENDQRLLKSMIVFACIMEGLFFYAGFSNMLAMGRSSLLPGACEQIAFIARDESNHASTGVDIINTIKHENPHLWTDQLKAELADIFKKAVALECDFIREAMPKAMLEIKPGDSEMYTKFICNRRCKQIGIPELYPEAVNNNPFPWMSEMLDLKKESNFFERKVTEYQSSSALQW